MATAGALENIEKLEQLPLRFAEAILEGLSKNTGDSLVLGMGFTVGYMGFDVMQYLMRPFKELAGGITNLPAQIPAKVADMAFDVANMPIEIGAGLGGSLMSLLGAEPLGKRITPATKGQITTPGVSYYGPAPAGFTGDWPPYGITLAQIKGEIDKGGPDKAAWQMEFAVAEFQLKLTMGCLSAIAAYTITRPGFIPGVLSGVGSIIQGVGEIVPDSLI